LRIPPEEKEIVGGWTNVQSRVEADSNSRRINELISHHLRKVLKLTGFCAWNAVRSLVASSYVDSRVSEKRLHLAHDGSRGYSKPLKNKACARLVNREPREIGQFE